MEVYIAADLSAERNEPVNLPLPESRPSVAVATVTNNQPQKTQMITEETASNDSIDVLLFGLICVLCALCG